MDVKNPKEGYCKEGVWHASGNWGSSYQCSRKAKVDGYCKQHHPDGKKARKDAGDARYKAEKDARRAGLIMNEKDDRKRILKPLIEALTSLRDEYRVSQPCRSPVDIVDGIIDLVREELDVPDDFRP
jgi:hypothetical protein